MPVAWTIFPLLAGLLLAACGGGEKLGGPPVATTIAQTSVFRDRATLNGEVTPNGLETTAWFEWGTSPVLDNCASTAPRSVGSGAVAVQFGEGLSGLSTGTRYYFRVAASNGSGTSEGSIRGFAAGTSPEAATAAAYPAFEWATLTGSAVANGLPTNVWFEWGTSATLETFSTTPAQGIGAGTAVVDASAVVSGLSDATDYYFRIVAENETETVRARIVGFRTRRLPW